MVCTDRPEPVVDDGVALEAKPACVALVPLIPAAQWTHGLGRRWTPNSIFVTHLIATADHAPQTRGLRRAAFTDAQTAYNAHQSPPRGVGSRMRQII